MRSGWIVAAVVVVAALVFDDDNDKAARDEPRTSRGAPWRSPDTPPLRFAGDECTDDCSGHRAGYEWAEERDVDDAEDCDGNSQSFIEGCRAYAEGRDPADS